jgi:hypothetical protein
VQDATGPAALAQHPVQQHDLVLLCRRARDSEVSVPIFPNRAAANAAFKSDENSWQCVSLLFDPQVREASSKVDATWELREGADPTNDQMTCYDVQSGKLQPVLSADKPFYMALHRDLHRGAGFYDTMQSRAKALAEADELIASMSKVSLDDQPSPAADAKLPSLPIINYLATDNHEYADALMEEALEHDRVPMRKYLSRVLLGLGVLTSVCDMTVNPLLIIVTNLFRVLVLAKQLPSLSLPSQWCWAWGRFTDPRRATLQSTILLCDWPRSIAVLWYATTRGKTVNLEPAASSSSVPTRSTTRSQLSVLSFETPNFHQTQIAVTGGPLHTGSCPSHSHTGSSWPWVHWLYLA